jgi:hypothetical protein
MLVGRLLRGLIFTIQKSLSHVHVNGMVICLQGAEYSVLQFFDMAAACAIGQSSDSKCSCCSAYVPNLHSLCGLAGVHDDQIRLMMLCADSARQVLLGDMCQAVI